MRLHAHIADAGTLPGPALCGKPRTKAVKGPALFVCGKCVAVLIEESKRLPITYRVTVWPERGDAA